MQSTINIDPTETLLARMQTEEGKYIKEFAKEKHNDQAINFLKDYQRFQQLVAEYNDRENSNLTRNILGEINTQWLKIYTSLADPKAGFSNPDPSAVKNLETNKINVSTDLLNEIKDIVSINSINLQKVQASIKKIADDVSTDILIGYPEWEAEVKKDMREAETKYNLGLIIPTQERKPLANKLDQYINHLKEKNIKEENSNIDTFYLECFKEMLKNNKLERPFDKADIESAFIISASLSNKKLSQHIADLMKEKNLTKEDKQKVDLISKTMTDRKQRIAKTYESLKELSPKGDPKEDSFSNLQKAMRESEEVKLMEKQLNDFWKWQETTDNSIPIPNDKCKIINDQLFSGFIFQVGSHSFMENYRAGMPKEKEIKFKAESELIKTIGKNLHTHPKIIILNIESNLANPIEELKKICSGTEAVADFKTEITTRMDKLQNGLYFNLLPKERQNEKLSEIRHTLENAAETNIRNLSITKNLFDEIEKKRMDGDKNIKSDTKIVSESLNRERQHSKFNSVKQRLAGTFKSIKQRLVGTKQSSTSLSDSKDENQTTQQGNNTRPRRP